VCLEGGAVHVDWREEFYTLGAESWGTRGVVLTGERRFLLTVLSTLVGVFTRPLYLIRRGELEACALWCPLCGRLNELPEDVVRRRCAACHLSFPEEGCA
jgi:hypothetical protein